MKYYVVNSFLNDLLHVSEMYVCESHVCSAYKSLILWDWSYRWLLAAM